MGHIVICELELDSRTLLLPERFFEKYKCGANMICGVPGPLIEAGFVQAGTLPAYKAMYEEIYSGIKSGTAWFSIQKAKGRGYEKVEVEWRLITDSSGRAVKAVGVISPIGLVPNSSLNAGEREELDELRARVALQATYLQLAEKYQKDLRRYQHDRKNNLIAVSALLDSGDNLKAKEYIASLGFALRQKTLLINTGNPAIDALITEKILLAREKGIEVNYTVGLQPNIRINLRDICTAVSCCLDNAVEACITAMKEYEQTSISLQLIEKRGVITFKMENTSVTPTNDNTSLPETTKNNNIEHGFGLKNVSSIVAKYHGILETIPENGKFITAFTLFLL